MAMQNVTENMVELDKNSQEVLVMCQEAMMRVKLFVVKIELSKN